MPERMRARVGRGLLLAVVAGLGGCTPLDDAMVAIFGRSMRDQVALDPYEHPLLPPPNSVPFAAGNFSDGPDQVTFADPDEPEVIPPLFSPAALLQQDPAVVNLENPLPATPEVLERGEELFLRFCAPCHGESGVGTEAYIAEVYPLLAAYDLTNQQARAYSDGYIYGMIRVGRGNMPAYGHRIANYDRWRIVHYVRQLQGGAAGGGDQADTTAAPGNGGSR